MQEGFVFTDSFLRSSSPLSQPQSSHSPSPDPPTWYESSGVLHCQPSGFIRTDRQSLTGRVPEGSPYQWRYMPAFGIVHRMGCDICTQFINHMIDAQCCQDFQNAVMERDNQYDRHFCDGISEGRRKQKQDVNEEVLFFRAASQNAEAALARSLEENLALGREVEALKDHLQTRALKRSQNNDLTFPGHSSTSIGVNNISSSPNESQPARTSLSYAAAVSFKVTSTDDSTSIPIQHPGQQQAVSFTATASHSVPPRPSGPFPTSPSTTLRAAIAQAPGPLRNNRFPRTLQDLQWLMKAAHKPGNDMHLAKVKSLCAEAHATPREGKTELQKVLLSKWRNPEGIAQASSLEVKMNPRIDDSVETWYSYLCMHQGSWPRGVRKDLLGQPIMSDLRASRMISRLRPEAGLKSSSPNPLVSKAAFMQQVIFLFSRPGAYHRILVGSGITVAQTLSYLPFHERTGPITVENLVRHCAACGITVQMAAQDFEPWASNYLEMSSPTPPWPNASSF